MGEPALIELSDLAVGYGRRSLLSGIDLRVARGDRWGVVGPNGAGKTTLLKTMLGILRPVAGRVGFPQGAVRLGYVPQREALDPVYPLSALDVVVMGRYARRGWLGRLRAHDRRVAREALDRVGLGDRAGVVFRELSGGQLQRVLIARALASEPQVLVLDEPTNGMDITSAREILDLIARLQHEEALTVVLVSHELRMVADNVDHLAVINAATGVFRAGPVAEMVQSEVLSELYGQPIAVEKHGGHFSIFVSDAHRQAG